MKKDDIFSASGHRDRVRNKVRKGQLTSFTETEILEFLLFSCIKRKDTKIIAKTLLSVFGSLDDVLSVSFDELIKIKDMTKKAALFVSCLRPITTKAKIDAKFCATPATLDSVIIFCQDYYLNAEKNIFIITLIANNDVVQSISPLASIANICDGSILNIPPTEKETAELRIHFPKTSKIILAYNPSDDLPFDDEIEAMLNLCYFFREMNIEIIDVLKFVNNDITSFCAMDMLKPISDFMTNKGGLLSELKSSLENEIISSKRTPSKAKLFIDSQN